MRKTLIALMFAAALPTVAMAAVPEAPRPAGGPEGHMMCGPEGRMPGGPEGRMMGGPGPHEHGPRGRGGPFGQLDLNPEQHRQIAKLMGEQMHGRKEIAKKYLDKLPAPEQKAMQDEMDAARQKTQTDIRSLLNADQQKQFDVIVKKQAERRAEWREFKAWKAQQPQKAQ